MLALALFPHIAQSQTYLFNYERFGGYIRIPSFSITQGAISSLNTSEGFQFNITLSRYRIQFTNISIPISRFGWTWHYQPPLNEELNLSEYEFVNATHAINNSVVVAHRPENVVGSYAVYSDYLGNEYGTGKVLHLYRPLLIDANGAMLWANLNVTDGILNISCNQTWMQNAAYPVIIDPSFGYAGQGGSYTNTGTNDKIGCQYTANGTGTLESITMYVYFDSSTTFHAAVYSDNSNTPNALLANVSKSVTAGAKWETFTGFSLAITNATAYWLTINTPVYIELYYDSVSTYRSRVDSSDTPPPDTTFGTGTSYTDRRHSIYANFTEGVTEQNIVVDYSEYGNVTATLATQKNLYRVTSETSVISIDLFGVRGVIRVNTETVVGSDGLSSVKTLIRVSGESTSVTTTVSSNKSLTAVLAELLETVAITGNLDAVKGIYALLSESTSTDALLATVKALIRVSGESTAITTISSSAKSITAVIAELLETAASTAGLTVNKNIFAALIETVGAEALLDVVKHLAATLFEFAETANISEVLYVVLPVIPLSAEDALGVSVALIIVFFSVSLAFVFLFSRRNS